MSLSGISQWRETPHPCTQAAGTNREELRGSGLATDMGQSGLVFLAATVNHEVGMFPTLQVTTSRMLQELEPHVSWLKHKALLSSPLK